MPTSKERMEHVLNALRYAEDISVRPMMGEYVLYCKGKVIGGVYDERLLLKITRAGENLLPEAERQLPYVGGKEMMFIGELSDGAFLKELCEKTADELPMPKINKRK